MSKKITLLILSLLLAISVCFASGCVDSNSYYTVSFNSNGGTAIESVQVLSGRTAEKPADPTKQGYVFAGWYLGDEEYSFDHEIREDIQLDAKWEAGTGTAYTVKHLHEKLEGGYEEIASDTQVLTGTTDALTSATANEYVGFTAQEIEQVSIAPDGSSVVEVKYDRILIEITWVIDGVSSKSSFKYGAMPSCDTPTKAADEVYSYTFSGWDSELVPVTEQKTYTASFSSSYVNYSVVFVSESGEELSRKDDYHYGDTIVVPAAPEKPADKVYSYTFAGWNNPETVSGNAEYKATYTATYVNYTVQFANVNGVVFSQKTDYHYGDEVVAPEHSESEEGYTYGWDKEIVAVEGDAIYTETKTPKTYSVTLNANGGELNGELASYVYTKGASLPTASKIGHTFKGWSKNEDLSGDPLSEISATELGDKTYYAIWEANVYSVTLVPGSGALDGELTAYTYGVGASLPNATKKGYTLAGWYESEDFAGEAVSEISATDLGDKTYYANYTPNKDTKYQVTVLVASYASVYNSGYYYVDLSKLTYVDATSQFAEVFGLDANGMAQGETDSTVDLAEVVAELHGASLNAESVASGVIDADESLKLTLKLDVNEQDLGFALTDICTGQWSWENLVYTLGCTDGVCGLLVSGNTTAFGKEIIINLDPVNVTAYGNYSLVIYDKGLTSGNSLLVNDLANNDTFRKKYATADSEEYVKYSLRTLEYFPNEKVINKIRLVMSQKEAHNVLIKGIETVDFVKESVTYSVENGNIAGIASGLNGGVITEESHYFASGAESIALSANALAYKYGKPLSGEHCAGVVFNLGAIRVSDYSKIEVVFDTISNNKGTVIYANGINIRSGLYGGAHRVDIKAAAEAAGVTVINTLEIAHANWTGIEYCEIYVAYIELVVDENAPEHSSDVSYIVNLFTDEGELESDLSSYVFGKGATLPGISKQGYDFMGWYTNNAFSGEPVTQIGASEFGNKTFFAKFEAKQFNVTLNTDGGVLESELTSYVYGVGAILPTISKPGHAFMGWYESSDFAGEEVTQIGANELGDKEYFAKWQVNSYNVTLNANGGVLESELTSYVYGVGAVLPIPTKDGDTFAGWYDNSGFAGDPVTEIGATDLGDKEYFAKWQANTYNVTLNANGGELESELASYIYGIGAVLPTAVKDGHTFMGWYESAELVGDAVTQISATDLGDKEYFAKWQANEYAVVLNDNGGILESELTSYVYGVGATLPAISKANHEFGGWYETEDFAGDPVTQISATDLGDKIFYAKFTEIISKKTVIYSVDNGNIAGIASGLGAGTLSEANHNFANNAEGISVSSSSLLYKYEGEAVTGMHATGVKFNLGKITLSDYKSVKVLFQTVVNNGGTNVFCGDTEVASLYGGAHLVDLKALSEAKGIAEFSTLELSISSWASVTSCEIYVAYIELVLKPETVTYSVDNGNIAGIASVLTSGSVTESSRYFANNDEGIALSSNALLYKYEGEAVSGSHVTGVKFDLGKITLSDYKSIKILFQSEINAGGTNVFCDGVELVCPYGGAHLVDIKALAESKGITEFSTLELSTSSWANVTSCKIYVAYIEFVLKPQSVTYSIANGNLASVVTPLSGGTISEDPGEGFGSITSSAALVYTYTSDTAISANHVAGVKINLGNIELSDYASIKIIAKALNSDGSNSNLGFLYCDTYASDIGSVYKGAVALDVLALCNNKNVTSFSELEISLQGWAGNTSYILYIASIELVVAE